MRGLGGVEDTGRISWTMLLDWGVVTLTLVAAGTSMLAALVAFHHEDTPAMAEAVLATAASLAAAFLGRSASRAIARARLADLELRAAFGQARFGVLMADRDGRVLDANAALRALLGYEETELTTLSVVDLNRPADRPRATAWLRRLVSGEVDSFTDERWYLRKDGSEVPTSITASAVRDNAGVFRFLIAVVEDETEVRETRARLVAAERMAAVGSVAAGMAHDINNPLCSVQGNLSYALEVADDPVPDLTEMTAALTDARDAANRVREIVRDLNAFAGSTGEAAGITDVGHVVKEAVDASDLARRRARIVVDVPALPRIRGPASRMAQVLESIVRRAAEAMPEGSADRHEIRITARADGPLRLAVEIFDNGPILPSAEALHLFEPFYALRPDRRSGAGLAAVLGMVKAVGGDVRAECKAGQGNVIRVLLPIAPSPEA